MTSSHLNGKRILRDAIDLLERHGAAEIEYQRNRHVKLRWSYRGKRTTTVLPVTPSDRRTHHNIISKLKRQLRAVDSACV